MDDKAFFKLSYGLFVLSVHVGKRHNACIVNTAIQVASSPDRIAVAVNKNNFTCDMLDYTDEFTVSVIAENAKFSLFERFGFQSGKTTEKFEGFDGCKLVKNGTYAITEGTNAYLSAKIVEKSDLGTHILFIAEVTDSEVLSFTPSATYEYYRENIKPKPKKQTENNGKTTWRCSVCGYEYEGEQLPDGFTCPICKHGAEVFEKV